MQKVCAKREQAERGEERNEPFFPGFHPVKERKHQREGNRNEIEIQHVVEITVGLPDPKTYANCVNDKTCHNQPVPHPEELLPETIKIQRENKAVHAAV